ncbi:tryptophan--tRNA ligase, partial [Patescibacteria group bacterium]|nr:tryptophan--tRNA ligase [Patescibacteria group bacterium]
FSGIAPSGNLHVGNYIGAVRNWVKTQSQKANIFCVVDLHALTVPQNPEKLRAKIREVAALYLACGIDPEQSNIFVQSHNSDHAQLAWLLDCITPMGWMRRMTQFKDKSQKQKELVSVGLFNYPVLMAADILLYQANEVPVGEDQKQHVEIARDIAEKFNSRYGEVFTLPEAVIDQASARIMSLQEPTSKMSKSDPDANGAIFLLDDLETARRKIKIAVTDSGKEIRRGKDKPALTNLLTIFSTLSGRSDINKIEEEYQGSGYKEFKQDLTEVIVEFLRPIQQKYQQIQADKTYLDEVLEKGLEAARPISGQTLRSVQEAMGLVS